MGFEVKLALLVPCARMQFSSPQSGHPFAFEALGGFGVIVGLLPLKSAEVVPRSVGPAAKTSTWTGSRGVSSMLPRETSSCAGGAVSPEPLC